MEVTLERVAAQVSDVAKQLEQFQGMERRLAEHVESHLNAAVKELKHQGKLNAEDLKHDVKIAAEGYGATLDGIKRELEHLNKQVDTRFGDHDRVLHNHNERITKLETR